MKKFGLLMGLLLSAGGIMAQSIIEAVHLKNGGLVKGEIIEQVPGQSLKVKTKDGNIFVYQMDEVERITRESNEVETAGHRGLDFSTGLGYDVNTKGGGGSLAAELELGKRFSKSFYWGIGTGVYVPTGDGDPSIPITTTAKVFMPLTNSKLAPFIGVKAGYVINTTGEKTVKVGKYSSTIETPDNIMVQIMPGIQYPLSNTVDFNFGAGYTHFIPTKGSGSSGAITIRAGFGFHYSPTHQKRHLLPSTSNTIQLTLEAGGFPFGESGIRFGYYGGDIVVSYKLSQLLMVGLGGGYQLFDSRADNIRCIDFEGNYIRAFLRGQYRFTDRRFSPFIACDLGMRFYDNIDAFSAWDCSKNKLFVAPAIGISVRPSRNSYIDLKVGYDLSSKYKVSVNDKDYESGPLSCPFIKIGYTKTFAK